jgi:hypothetical protein
MIPVKFPESTTTFAEAQPEYLLLPAWTDGKEVISCWRLGLLERLKVLFSGRLWLRQLSFGKPLQPQRPQVECPFKREPTDASEM